MNKNYKERDQLLAPYYSRDEVGGIRYFRSLPSGTLQELIDKGFVEMGTWNDCPGVAKTFLPFLRRNPQFTAHGYAVTAERSDRRVTIEGIEHAAHLSRTEIIDFANSFYCADEFQLTDDYARCWYD